MALSIQTFALTDAECAAQLPLVQQTIARYQANTAQAFANNSRYKYVIQRLNNQKITALKSQYYADCGVML